MAAAPPPVSTGKSSADVKNAMKSARVTVLYFTAKWCGPCKRIGPEFERLVAASKVAGLKVDVDEADKDVLQHFQVEAMPTFVFIRDKQVIYTQQGADATALKTAFTLYTPETALCGTCGRRIVDAHHPEKSMCTVQPMCDSCVWLKCKACSTK